MSFIQNTDFALEVSRGNIPGIDVVNKFGRASDVDANVQTDIWDRANVTDGQDTWIAPTSSVIHNIKSSSASDSGSPPGVGARTLEVVGLTDFDTKEVSEIVTLNGTTDVPTVNSYVVIYRMEVLTKGATSVNVGAITATGVGGGNQITAQINIGEGQTQMAIYAIPSVQTGFMTNFYILVQAVASGKEIIGRLLSNREPQNELLNFDAKHVLGLGGTGTTDVQHEFQPYKVFEGPCIIKMLAVGDANNMDVAAGFDLYLVDN